jgi:hypothetical protein
VSFPGDFVQLLAVWFGHFPWDIHKPLEEDGSVGRGSHPWILQHSEDLKKLGEITSSDDISAAADRPLLLLLDEHVKDAFLRTDVKVLRAAWRAASVPPPSWQAIPQATQAVPDIGLPPAVFTCDLLDNEGQLCNKQFDTKTKLSVHQCQQKGGTHGLRRLSFHLIKSNQCLTCKAVFKTLGIARQHFETSLGRGHCRAELERGSITRHDVVQPANCRCELCDINFRTFDEAQWHFYQHLPDGFDLLV